MAPRFNYPMAIAMLILTWCCRLTWSWTNTHIFTKMFKTLPTSNRNEEVRHMHAVNTDNSFNTDGGDFDNVHISACMATALCVVPPDMAWDTLQRARHMARDQTYHSWPPAIRLFHPFVPPANLSNAALDVARILEKYNVEPFTIVLDSWTVMPLPEALDTEDQLQQLPMEADPEEEEEDEEYNRIQELIAREEQIGKQKKSQRARQNERRQREKQNLVKTQQQSIQSAQQQQPMVDKDEPAGDSPNDDGDLEPQETEEPSPKENLEKQKKMYQEFNGPSMIALEPDDESRLKLMELRELLRTECFPDYDAHSPSSSLSSAHVARTDDDHETTFRPLVPIGGYPTVDTAISVAKKLKGLWEPLEFNVTDLHFISMSSSSPGVSSSSSFLEQHQQLLGGTEGLSKSNHVWSTDMGSTYETNWNRNQLPNQERELSNRGHNQEQQEQFGCDALVMLVGEEIELDSQYDQDMVDLLMKKGEAGGMETRLQEQLDSDVRTQTTSTTISSSESMWERKLDVNDGNWEDLSDWLDEDDDYNEGTVVIMGRTHFFSGEMRVYVGMPATSITDAKDRSTGGVASMSGAARRKASSIAKRSFTEGEFGQRPSD